MPLEPLSKCLLEKLRLLHSIGCGSDLEISLELRRHTKVERNHSREFGFLDIATGFLKRRWFALRASERGWN
jgi:hypothetical protein